MQRLILALVITLTFQTLSAQIMSYKAFKEPKSKIILREYNYIVEKLPDGSCILKRFYPETKAMIDKMTFKSKKLQVKHGEFFKKYDDGTVIMQGMFENDKKVGEWIEKVNQKGHYSDDKKEGIWTEVDSKGRLKAKFNYANGELAGEQLHYDTLGNVKYTQVVENGVIISSDQDTSDYHTMTMPRFPGCNYKMMKSKEECKKCSDSKLVAFLIKNLKYPKKARNLEIQGIALVSFIVARDGSIDNVKILRGVSKEIEKEVIRLMASMPQWIPGTKNNEPVRVAYQLPIVFNLH